MMDRYITRTPRNNNNRIKKGLPGNYLTVIQLNCGSGGLNAVKQTELKKFLYESQPDIVLLQETWFNDKYSPHFTGYSIVYKNRINTYKTTGGGVAILIRESAGLIYTPIPNITAPDDKSTDIIQANLKWNGREIIVTSIYNPPVSSRPRNLQGFSAEYTLSACIRTGSNHIIGGDFNAHSTTWDSAPDVIESEEGAEIEEWLRDNSATLGNSGDPTLRHATTGRQSAVDLSIHLGDVVITDWRTIPALGFSDHAAIAFSVRREYVAGEGERARQRTTARETKFCYDKADWKKFNRYFDIAYRNFVDSPRKRQIKRKRKRNASRYRFVTRPRSNPLELENRRVSAAFRTAMKTIPQGCRLDPVPW